MSLQSTSQERTASGTDRPAILGGRPAVTLEHTEALRWPVITEADEQAVLRVLRSGELSIHEETAALEADYRRWLGIEYAVAHCNGTGAIHAALHAFGIGAGDEVIVPSATWWSSVLPVLHCGALPVFAEAEDTCLGLDPEDVERRITPRTRAIIVVHLFGIPSRMDELMAVANRHGLRVLEDASHAHGARYHGRPVGTIGHAAVFSMQANKLVPSAEGGMFVTRDKELWERALCTGHYERLLTLDSPLRRFAATGWGYKFRMSPLSAAVARTQLAALDGRNALRNANCRHLSEQFQALGLETFMPPPDVERVYFEFLVRVPEHFGASPAALARALQAEGAQVGAPRYPLLHQQPLFTEGHWMEIARWHSSGPSAPRFAPDALPRTERGNKRMLRFPAFPNASRELLDQYAEAVRKVVAHATELPEEAAR